MNQPAHEKRPEINRNLVAVITLVCLCAGAYIGLTQPDDQFWAGSFVRVGLLMGAFWYAAPTKGRAAAWANVSPWWIVGVAGLLLLIVRRPRVLIPFGIAIMVLGIVIPKVMGAGRK